MITHSLQRKKLFLILFSVVFLASFYFDYNIGGAGLTLPYASAIWIAALVFIAVGVFISCFAKSIYLPRFWIALAMLPLGLVISGTLAEVMRPIEWALRMGYVLGGFLFLFVLFQYRPDRRSIETLLFCIVLAGLGHSLVHLAMVYEIKWLSGWLPISSGKGGGVFQQVNLLASFVVTGIIISFYLMTVPGFGSRTNLYKVFILINISLGVAVFLSTGSRTGLLGLILGTVILVISRYRFLLRHKKSLIGLVVAISIGIAYGFHLSDGMGKVEKKLQSDGYENSRIVVYQLSWEIFAEKPLFGHGIGSFPRVFQEKRIPFQKEHPEAHSADAIYYHPHNEILFWLVETGLISVLGMIVAGIASMRQLWLVGWSRGGGYLAMILPISLHTMVELPFYMSPIHWFLWLFLLYLIHHNFPIKLDNKLSHAARKFIPAVVLVFALVGIGFFIHTLKSLDDFMDFLDSGGKPISKLERINENPALAELGMKSLLRALLFEDIRNRTSSNVERFITWTENAVLHAPEPKLLGDLAMAYAYMGDNENARRVIDYAVSIYTKSNLLGKRREQIYSATFSSPEQKSLEQIP